jgi:hypothetical protein
VKEPLLLNRLLLLLQLIKEKEVVRVVGLKDLLNVCVWILLLLVCLLLLLKMLLLKLLTFWLR